MKTKKLTIGLLLAFVPLGIGALMLQGQTSGEGPRLFAQVLRMVEQYSVDSLSNAEIYEKAARGL
ncbi:MAG: hypothetical protein H6R40_1664, partial [Gemmatimonadetes bacterium]|nr:hypothetical protein [Gemmatimonadota bacterium]